LTEWHARSLPQRPDLVRALGLSAALCLVLASRVYVSFDPVRLKLVQAPSTAAGGQLEIAADDANALEQLTTPVAVIARLRHHSPSTERFEIQIDGTVACSPRVRPNALRRVDCAWTGDWKRAPTHQVTVRGPTSAWTLEYLEVATHHGATRAHDLLVVPSSSRNYLRPHVGWIAVTWIALAIVFLMPGPAYLPRAVDVLNRTAAIVVAGLLAAISISSLVTPFTVLLSPRGFVRSIGVLLALRLWVLGTRLAGWPRDGARQSASRRLSPVLMLLVSGVLGFRVGIVGFPSWHVAVETSQVVAGLVNYPPGNPFYAYHTNLWTALHQILAVFLLAGASEITLSMMMSGVLGMVSFLALSIMVYALSRDALLAVASAFFIFFTGIAESGVIYPISLMGTTHTYGALGLSWVVLVAGVLGANWRRSGSFLLGITPAVHLSIGLWFALIVAVAAAWDFRRFRDARTVAVPHLLAGCGLTLASLAVQFALTHDAPPMDGVQAARYLTAFVGFWDGHRAPVPFDNAGVALNAGALGLALLWLTFFVSAMPRPAAFLLRIVAVSAALSLGLALLSQVPPTQLPASLVILMPGRMLNFNAVIFPALLLGLIGMYGRNPWGGWLALSATAALLLNDRSSLWTWSAGSLIGGLVPERGVDALLVLGLASIALIVGARFAARDAARHGPTLASLAALAIMGWTATQTWKVSAQPLEIFRDRTNDPVFSAAAGEGVMLATSADLHLVQLRSRRPVLLDGGGLDGLPYAIEAGPEMERILRDVYAIDFFHPPEEARGAGTIPRGPNRAAWESYSGDEWRHIRGTYGVTHVLAYADWNLALPVVTRDSELVLYRIPLTEHQPDGSW
jgi:hypothetical protein